MPDPAQINRSLGTIKTELEYLANSGVLSPPQLQSIQAQLPHHEWASKLAHKFGNAAVYGAGATFGADLVNDAMRKF
ncbi:unnamed protein product [Alternaria alternata]